MREGGLRKKGVIKKSSPKTPLISVITSTYNSAELLPRVARSIRDQSYSNIEWIIVDGDSNDSTLDEIQNNEDVIDYWVSDIDNGIYDAWNKGVSFANGDWVAFLGSDDAYYPDAIEEYVRYIFDHNKEELDYISSRVELVGSDGSVIQILGSAWDWQEFKKVMNVAHVGSLHHRRIFQNYGLFDESYKITADYELLLRARSNLRAGFLDSVTARMQAGGVSTEMLPAFVEAKRAKHETGGRAKVLCDVDNVINIMKILIKKAFIKKCRC
jgi:glycosyltransferase involved in cell wall biosynthesis